MKNVKLYVCGLLVAMLLAACANYDELDTQQQLELGDPVLAQFTINIPHSKGSGTRASDAVVQSAEDFRGMDNIKLYAFATPTITGSSETPGSIGLIQMLKPTRQTVSNSIPTLDNSKAVLFGDVLVPSGTNGFLFYGKALDNADNANDWFKYGKLNAVGLDGSYTTPSTFSFEPVSITTAENSNTKRTAICTYLNSIKTAWPSNVFSETYSKFTGLKAGSSANLQASIQKLYNVLKDNTSSEAEAIKTAISNTTYVNATDIANDIVTFNSNIAGYPSMSDNLPDGAAILTFTDANGFAYAETSASASTLNVAAITDYVYPPSLYYRVKSNIKVSNQYQEDKFTSSVTWNDNASTGIFKYFNDGTTVSRDTRSVILVEPVQYSVGRLDVRLVSNTVSTLSDHNDVAVDFTNGKIQMTGILIGSQREVDWQFHSHAETEEFTLYEDLTKENDVVLKDIINANIPNTISLNVDYDDDPTLMTRTMVFETPGSDTEKVNVALEFVNNTGADFAGKEGDIIPNGCKFYLIGALDMSTVSAQIATKGNKIFQQDVVTLANFKINNLKNAVNTIPNLKMSDLELGLSVDLTWGTGYNQIIDVQ